MWSYFFIWTHISKVMPRYILPVFWNYSQIVKNLKKTVTLKILLKIKKKTTFPSSTLEFEEIEVVLFSHFGQYFLCYGQIWLFIYMGLKPNLEKFKIGYNLRNIAQNEKIRPLCFLQHWKLKKAKWAYFCHLSHI